MSCVPYGRVDVLLSFLYIKSFYRFLTQHRDMFTLLVVAHRLLEALALLLGALVPQSGFELGVGPDALAAFRVFLRL